MAMNAGKPKLKIRNESGSRMSADDTYGQVGRLSGEHDCAGYNKGHW